MSILIGAFVGGMLLVALVAGGIALMSPEFRRVSTVIALIGFALAMSAVGFMIFVISRMN